MIAVVAAAAAIGACGSVLAACGGQTEVTSVGAGARAPRAALPGAGAGKTVEAGTIVTAHVDQDLDSYATRPGTPFTATVTAPVTAMDGTVVVPYGAKVHGVVVGATSGAAPRLRVRLDSIDTVAGQVPLRAEIREAEHVYRAGPPQLELYSDSLMLPYDSEKYGDEIGQISQQPGPPVYGFEMTRPGVVHMPRGARLELELRQPLVVPSAP